MSQESEEMDRDIAEDCGERFNSIELEEEIREYIEK